MKVFEVEGRIGPVEALDLRHRIDQATAEIRPQVVVDLSGADYLHPAAVVAIIRGAERARYAAGALRVVRPSQPGVARMLDLVAAEDLLR